MDRRILRSASCNNSGKNSTPSSPAGVSRSASVVGTGSKDEAIAGERKVLLPRQRPPGGMARKGHKASNRHVQWKDRHGKKLTEVLEFQPRYAGKSHYHLHFMYTLSQFIGTIILHDDCWIAKLTLISWHIIDLDDFCATFACLGGTLICTNGDPNSYECPAVAFVVSIVYSRNGGNDCPIICL